MSLVLTYKALAPRVLMKMVEPPIRSSGIIRGVVSDLVSVGTQTSQLEGLIGLISPAYPGQGGFDLQLDFFSTLFMI